MDPFVVTGEGFVSFGEDVFDPHPFRQGFLLARRAHPFLLLPASWKVMSVDPGPLGLASCGGLVF